jgi:acyl dehydratase
MDGSNYKVTAINRAEQHPNLVHNTEFARSVGYRSGLVPGVDVFAHVAHAVSVVWGLDWLSGGGLEVRFIRPVYEGDQLTVATEADGDRLQLQVRTEAEICATGTAERAAYLAPVDPGEWPLRPLPAEPPTATRETFEATPVLGTLEETFAEEKARAQLSEVQESLSAFVEQRVVHPGHLLRLADSILSANVALPPWMHVSSRATFFTPVHWGDTVSARARVVSLFEKSRHQFVQLEILAFRGPEPVMRVNPYTAIYRPAFVH